mgnify:CR=1 FL=1
MSHILQLVGVRISFPEFIHPLFKKGPGIFGHTSINAALKYVDPLVISVTLMVEPIVGSVMGWMLDLSGIPGLCMCHIFILPSIVNMIFSQIKKGLGLEGP